MDNIHSIESFIENVSTDARYAPNIIADQVTAPKDAIWSDIPPGIRPELKTLLSKLRISRLYNHQTEAMAAILRRQNVVLSSGVASGKSLCYQIPILNELLNLPASRTFLLFPTKALAQDQFGKMNQMLSLFKQGLPAAAKFSAGIYDGDTGTDVRSLIRRNSSLVFTNPDMLHLGILPNHTLWSGFFANLRYVVLDEVHIYRGVFGSNVANIIRRLRRICRFYGSDPQFICTSATLANARELSENLTETTMLPIATDGSPHGKRVFYILNPPMIDPQLGIRRSALIESTSLAKRFLKTGCQAILFTETRRNVEILFRYLIDKTWDKERIRSYRSGYLAEDRRQIESDLRDRKIDIVVSTNALELGIDIGGLDAVFINGYPGTICGTRQQSGRAGRKGSTALTVLVATANPLDQYICTHPEYLFENSPERALIDPDNPEILLRQVLCAVYDMAMLDTEAFGALNSAQVLPILQMLIDDGKIRKVGSRYVGVIGKYPSGEVSIRNLSSQYRLMNGDEMIGYVDAVSANWMTHPNAIYLHQGDTWIVNKLDHEQKRVDLEPSNTNYYTQAAKTTEIELNQLMHSESIPGGKKYLGKVTVTSLITGFKKLRFFTQELLGMEDLEMAPSILQTVAWWIALSPETVQSVRDQGLWRNHNNDYGKEWTVLTRQIRERDQFRCVHCGVMETDRAHDVHHVTPFRKFADAQAANSPENLVTLCPRCHRIAESSVQIQSGLAAVSYLLGNLSPFFVMCEQKDIGVHSEDKSALADGNPVIVIYDSTPGGIGLSKKLYSIEGELLRAAIDAVSNCPCEIGCPSCVGPVAENGEGAKEHALAILTELCKVPVSTTQIIDFPPANIKQSD